MKLTFTVFKADIDKEFERVVKQAIAETSIKGFRKGQAPRDLVIKEVGETKLQQLAIEEALPKAYIQAINDKKLKPVTYPEITLKSGKPGEDFEFEAEIVEKPEIKLGDYKKAVSDVLKASAIWTPDKGEAKDKPETTQEEKIDKVLGELLKVVKFEVPQLLIDREVHRQMSRLVDQLTKMGLKVEDYLKSTNQTKDSLNKQYHDTSRDQIALEFILMEIANDLKIEVSPAEVDAFIKAVGDPKVKEQLQTPEQRSSIVVMLTKQAVIQALLKL